MFHADLLHRAKFVGFWEAGWLFSEQLAWLDVALVAAVLLSATSLAYALRHQRGPDIGIRWRVREWAAIVMAAFLPGFGLVTFDLPATFEVDELPDWHSLVDVAGLGVALFLVLVYVVMLR